MKTHTLPLLCRLYIVFSYAYYKKDDPMTSDYEFDSLCSILYYHWDAIPNYYRSLGIRKSLLKCGSGFSLRYKKWVERWYNGWVSMGRSPYNMEEYLNAI